jgi:hypothetical protein
MGYGQPIRPASSGAGVIVAVVAVVIVFAAGAGAFVLMRTRHTAYEYSSQDSYSTKRSELPTAQPASSALTAPHAPAGPLDGWTLYKSPDGGYEVMMPSTPEVTVKPTTTVAGDVDMHMAMSDMDSGSKGFVVSYSDFPIVVPNNKAQRDSTIDGAFGGMQSKADSRSELKLAGHDATIGRGTHPELGAIAVATFSDGRRHYQLLVLGVSDTAKVDAFLASFKLTKPEKGAPAATPR